MSQPDKQVLRQKIMGALLSHARVRAGRSQADLAAALHVSRQRYAAYEHGQQDLSLAELEAVAQLCGVPLGYFFDGELLTYHPAGTKKLLELLGPKLAGRNG